MTLRSKLFQHNNTEQGHSTRKQHPPGKSVGYIIRVEGQTIYHVGDTDILSMMVTLGHIDVACLPIGGKFTLAPFGISESIWLSSSTGLD